MKFQRLPSLFFFFSPKTKDNPGSLPPNISRGPTSTRAPN